jgi:two-component system cell cycle response regulator
MPFMNDALLNHLKNSSELPTLPVIAMKALEMARNDEADIAELANLISNDPALSTKILKTVNSSFYGLSKQVSTISHALVILGLQAVKTLALGFSLVGNLRGSSGDKFDYVLYWKKSLYSAVAARLIARRLNIVQQEEAFLGALLADIGVLVMHRTMGEVYDVIYDEAGKDHEALRHICMERLGIDHARVGGMLAEMWHLPPLLAKPIAQHHEITDTDPQILPLLNVVYTAMICGDVFAQPNPAIFVPRAREAMVNRLKLSMADHEELMTEIGKSTREVAMLFDMQVPNRSYQDVLNEANQTLIQMTLQTQKKYQEVEREKEHFREAAATDGLTGLANRAKFNTFIEEEFGRAMLLGRPLAILFLDVDHFKKCNDAYGHQGGDEVLRQLGKLLKQVARGVDLAARYGGEEFALVLSDTDSNSASQSASKLRQLIEKLSIRFEGKTIPITASIGVASTDGTRVFATATQLTNAADRAVYAAKQAGRNTVRLFRAKAEAGATAR